MQSTSSPKPTDFWWPHPDSFSEIVVEDTEEGFTLSAPDESEAGQWLAYYNSTEELHAQFNQEFTKALMNHLEYCESQETPNDNTA